MRIYKHIFILFVSVVFFGCSDDLLDTTPTNKVVDLNYFQNENDVLLALNAVYAQNDYYYTSLRYDAISDDAIIQHENQQFYWASRGIATASDWHIYDLYKFYYRCVSRANHLIANLSGVDGIDDDMRLRYEAEARFVRAYSYWVLTSWYGKVPLITKPIDPKEVKTLVRTPVEDVYEFLVKDLDWCAKNLPVSYDSENIGRATKGAALSLKSKVLLFGKQYSQAAAAAKEVMDLKVYELYPDYAELFTVDGENSKETIFERRLQPNIDGCDHFNAVSFAPNSIGGWSTLIPLQALVDAYECTDGKTIAESSLYDPKNPYDHRDPRLGYSIWYPGAEYIDGFVYNSIPGATYPGRDVYTGDVPGEGGVGSEANKTRSGYNIRKYVEGAYYDPRSKNFWYNGIDIILMRYAEVLLVYAEAKIEANDIDASVYDAITEVRQRAGMPEVDKAVYNNQETLRELVRRERRVELAFEGKRPFDIRRWRIAEKVFPGVAKGLTYTDPNSGEEKTFTVGDRSFDPGRDYLWPIPQREMDLCPMFKQNPKY
ncbi:RagB/SusD family nutrient uptake outer membrane protein [Marinilabiliaceae bacterium JC017]|nr:RagB/SusD family nutrient uptake outer membrane protein [Marinilabiliaceae bacterium JC017]